MSSRATAMRGTIIVGDSKSGTERVLRRQLFFTEPNSGRRTLRAQTGHAGGRSHPSNTGPPQSPVVLLPPSARLDKISSVWEGAGGAADNEAPSRLRAAHGRVGGAGGRGSNDAVRAHARFAQSLRADQGTDEDGEVSMGNETWRALAGFEPLVCPAPAPLRPALSSPQFNSEEDRRRVGFADKGLKRFGTGLPSGPLLFPRAETLGQSAALVAGHGRSSHERSPAGGPPGPKALVDWRDWRAKQAHLQTDEREPFGESSAKAKGAQPALEAKSAQPVRSRYEAEPSNSSRRGTASGRAASTAGTHDTPPTSAPRQMISTRSRTNLGHKSERSVQTESTKEGRPHSRTVRGGPSSDAARGLARSNRAETREERLEKRRVAWKMKSGV